MAQPNPNRIQPLTLDESSPPQQAPGGGLAGEYVASYLKSTFQNFQANSTKELRPMSDFFAKDKFSLPGRDVVSRVKTNLGFYSSNYAAIFILLAIYCVLSTPSFLFWLAVFGGLYYYIFKWRSTPVVISSYELSPRMLSVVFFTFTASFFVIFSVGSTMFWLSLAALAFIFLHATFHTAPEVDEFGFGLPTTMPQQNLASPVVATPTTNTIAPLPASDYQ